MMFAKLYTVFTVKNRLPEFYRKKYGNNILGFTVLTYIFS